jgi:hypothetical protein
MALAFAISSFAQWPEPKSLIPPLSVVFTDWLFADAAE